MDTVDTPKEAVEKIGKNVADETAVLLAELVTSLMDMRPHGGRANVRVLMRIVKVLGDFRREHIAALSSCLQEAMTAVGAAAGSGDRDLIIAVFAVAANLF